MPRAVIDASAILAVLLREPGSDVVETYYAQGIVSAVNLSEVAAKLCDLGMGAAEARDLLSALGLEIRAFDETQALAAGALREVTWSRGLSLGDRACLALGIAEGVPVVTTDRNWEAVSTQARAEVVVIR